jgi:exodeoxyribonuclease VII large subunit
MSENFNGKQVFTLLEVTKSIESTIAKRYGRSYWIKAEMNKLNYYTSSGHCYPELVEKVNGKIATQIRSTLWKNDFNRINKNFLEKINEPLKDGIKILFLAKIQYSPQHGLTLTIIDIDPTFTLGDLEQEKQDTIQKLKDQGVFSQNRDLNLPLLPKRIAIISVETSKGYADFINVIESAKNQFNYSFFHMLFPSLLQGDNAVAPLIKQLQRIKKLKNHFDVVAIIRGGGGDVGLSCFNNFELAKEITLFPIPVLSGIGHATNETVTEMVSHENSITPTKLADFLIQKFHDFSVPLLEGERKIKDYSTKILNEAKSNFNLEVKSLQRVTKSILIQRKYEINQNAQLIIHLSGYQFQTAKSDLNNSTYKLQQIITQRCGAEKERISRYKDSLCNESVNIFKNLNLILNSTERNLNNLSPAQVLKRGYSITQLNGKSISSFEDTTEGDLLKTVLFEGSIITRVESTSKK